MIDKCTPFLGTSAGNSKLNPEQLETYQFYDGNSHLTRLQGWNNFENLWLLYSFLPGSHALCAGTFDFESKLMCVVEMPFHTKTCFGQITGMSSRVAAVPLDDCSSGPWETKCSPLGFCGSFQDLLETFMLWVAKQLVCALNNFFGFAFWNPDAYRFVLNLSTTWKNFLSSGYTFYHP